MEDDETVDGQIDRVLEDGQHRECADRNLRGTRIEAVTR